MVQYHESTTISYIRGTTETIARILQKTVINSLNKAILKIIHVSLSVNKTTCPEMVSLRTADVFPVVSIKNKTLWERTFGRRCTRRV